MNRLLWYVFAGTRGGPTRMRIARALLDQAQNMHQLARRLNLDYKTVDHNLRVLLKSVLVVCPQPEVYAALYYPSKNLLAARAEFDHIALRVLAHDPNGELGKDTRTAPSEDADG